MKTIQTFKFLFILVAMQLGLLTANAETFDSDKPVLSYDTEYNQSFTTLWDNTVFYNQWLTNNPNCFSAIDIADGYLQFEWVSKRIMYSKTVYGSPYVFQTTLDYSSPTSAIHRDGGMVLRFNDTNLEKLQEPGKISTFNQIGIALYPLDANTYRIQFNGPDLGTSLTTQTIITLPKPGDITSFLTGQHTVRVEDFGNKIYVYMNGNPFAKIVLGGLSGTTYTSGTVYDAALTQVGSFTDMVVPAIGKITVAQRGANIRLYNAMVKSNKAMAYDKVAPTYNLLYNMSGTSAFDQTDFTSNWEALSTFTSTNTTSSYWMLGWIDPRVIRTKNTYNFPYKYEVDLELVSSATTGGVIVRAPSAGDMNDLQEPTTGTTYNRSGIAFFSQPDGTGMNVQFSGVLNGASTPYKRILIPTVNAINFRNRGTIRIEDFGTNIYVYFNESALCRISFVSSNSGIVYDSNLSVLGTFENMVIPATDFKFGVACREGTATDNVRIHSIKISNGTLLSTGVNIAKKSEVSAYIQDNKAVVDLSKVSGKNDIQLFDLSGKLVYRTQVMSAGRLTLKPVLNKGVYVLRIEGDNGSNSIKLINK